MFVNVDETISLLKESSWCFPNDSAKFVSHITAISLPPQPQTEACALMAEVAEGNEQKVGVAAMVH